MTTTKPITPWKATPKDRLRDLAILFAVLGLTHALVVATPLKGKLAYFVLFFFLYAGATAILSYFKSGAMSAKDAFARVFITCGAILTLIPIFSILTTIIQKG